MDKHNHHYVANGQRTEGPDANGNMITYSFYRCDAPGNCNMPDKMTIKRWKAKRNG